MMRAGFRFLLLMGLLPPLLAAASPSLADDFQKLRRALAAAPSFQAPREPFKDLPGVKQPQKFDDPPATACTSYIGRSFWSDRENVGGYTPRMPRRIYRCDLGNDVTAESTRQPDEVDWKKQKRYYKPWIDDGFDRDRR